MMRKVLPPATFAPLACALLIACAAGPDPVAAADEPPSRAERVAQALSAAAGADAARDEAALVRAVRVIEMSGAKPLDETPDDPVPAWMERTADARPAYRGRPLGPGYRSGLVSAGGRDSFAQLFLSGTASTIAISAPTGDRLALKVVDKDNKPVCDRQTAQPGACRWVPLFTQRYKIEVQNLGKADARYFLVIE